MPDDVSAATTMLLGTLIVGGGVSDATVTVNDSDDALPEVSVAVHVTVVSPIANNSPEEALQDTGFSNPTASVADTSKSTDRPCGTDVVVEISAGIVIVGDIVSQIVMSNAVVLPSSV